MYLVQIIMLALILSWGVSELLKIPKELLRIMEIDLFKKERILRSLATAQDSH